jgi:hypothetical protein
MEQAKLLRKADCAVLHLISLTLAVLSSDPKQNLRTENHLLDPIASMRS